MAGQRVFISHGSSVVEQRTENPCVGGPIPPRGTRVVYMKIFIDDERMAPDSDWVIVRDLDQLKEVLEQAQIAGDKIESISFDHDLGQNEDGQEKHDGYYIVQWLAEHYPELIVGDVEHTIHSANTVGRENIQKYLEFCQRNKESLLASKSADDPFPEIRKFK